MVGPLQSIQTRVAIRCEGGRSLSAWLSLVRSRGCPGAAAGAPCFVFRSPGALTFGYGCTVHVGVDVGAGDAEVDVLYISFIMTVQHIEYLVPYKDRVQVDNWTTVYSARYDNLDREVLSPSPSG